MEIKRSIGVKIGGAFAVPLALLAGIGLLSFVTATGLIDAANWVTHTYQVIDGIDGLVQAMTDAETGQRGYLITGTQSYLQPYNSGTESVGGYLKELRDLTSDNPGQQKLLDSLQLLIASKFEVMRKNIALRESEGLAAVVPAVAIGEGKTEMDQIRHVAAQMKAAENKLLTERDIESKKSSATLISVIAFGIPGGLVLVLFFSILIVRNIAPSLKSMTVIARHLSQGDVTVPISSDGRGDEVGVLTRTFADMALYLQSVAASATQIAGGDLAVRIVPVSDKDVLG
ncbi:MAG TPA: CHASE3 domain-containing protein, partial [Spirochaetia bacterium]|nr:CHASE3 domain-containing protein [Spirochaetia bacterium]